MLAVLIAAALAAAPTPSDHAHLRPFRTLGGAISPKSVAASGTGLVLAQNMMYRHTVTVYDARRLRLREDDLRHRAALARSAIPVPRHRSAARPVEAAFSPDGRYAYVSNYSMYGAGLRPRGARRVLPGVGLRRQLRLPDPLDTLRIDRAYRVGPGAEGRRVDP